MDAWTRKDRLELPKAQRPWWKKKRFLIPGIPLAGFVALIAFTLIIVAIAGPAPEQPSASAPAPTTAAPETQAPVIEESPAPSKESITAEVVAAVEARELAHVADVVTAHRDGGAVVIETTVVDPRGADESQEARWAVAVCEAVVEAGLSSGMIYVQEADGTTFATNSPAASDDGSCAEY